MPVQPRPKPAEFHVFDTTLRDGSQQEGLSLSVGDKLAIAALLDELGSGSSKVAGRARIPVTPPSSPRWQRANCGSPTPNWWPSASPGGSVPRRPMIPLPPPSAIRGRRWPASSPKAMIDTSSKPQADDAAREPRHDHRYGHPPACRRAARVCRLRALLRRFPA